IAMSRSRGSVSFTCSPSMRIVPPVTSSRPATMRSAVVLPQPDGPTSTISSPSAMDRSSPLTAVVPSGNCLVMPSSTIAATPFLLRALYVPYARACVQHVAGQGLGGSLAGDHVLPCAGEVQLIQAGPAERGAGRLAHRD